MRITEIADALLAAQDGEVSTMRRPVGEDLVEGERLLQLFLGCSFVGDRQPCQDDPVTRWCHRRVVTLRFLAQRRGHWMVGVDFTLVEWLSEISTLIQEETAFVPLFTVNKYYLPLARLRTADERERRFPIESTELSSKIMCIMLLTLASHAGLWDRTVLALIAKLMSTDPRVYEPALVELEERLEHLHKGRCPSCSSAATPSHRGWSSDMVIAFGNAARLFARSVVVLAGFHETQLSKRKVVTLTYDAPIRLTRKGPELSGWSPLRVAPLIVFGGDASSYHVQLEPLEGVVGVDTTLFYAYTAASALHHGPGFVDQPLRNLRKTNRWNRALLRLGRRPTEHGDPLGVRPLKWIARCAAGQRRFWGIVTGAAEPMSPHVWVSGARLPRLIEGRDVVTMFQLYPDISAVLGVIVGALLNFAYLSALFVGFVTSSGLNEALSQSLDPLLLVGVLVAGFGSGLAYRREHLVTNQVARPWRLLFAFQVGAVIAWLLVLLFNSAASGGFGLRYGARVGLSVTFVLSVLATSWLVLISVRAWLAQRAGARMLAPDRQGLALRRRRFAHHEAHDEAPDLPGVDFDLTREELKTQRQRSASPQMSEGPTKPLEGVGSRAGMRRLGWSMTYLASDYLNEDRRRVLIGRGVPIASRHDPGSRGL